MTSAGTAVRFRRHPEATRILVLGFLGLTICPLLAPLVWRQGNRVLAEIDEHDAADGPDVVTVNRASAYIGQRTAIVGTVLWALVAAALLVMAVIAAIDAVT